MRYVRQKHECGCAVACIAMITGEEYDDVEKCFKEDFSKQCVSQKAIQEYIEDHGFGSVKKQAHGFPEVRTSNEQMSKPFAPAHIAHVLPYINAKNAHSVVMDAKGRVYDPQHSEVKDFSSYYYIISVTGYFYEGKEDATTKSNKSRVKKAPAKDRRRSHART